jgi:succinate-acetate transporter protein
MERFGEPAPLGLLGLAVGCAALVPIAFGIVPKDPSAAAMTFETCAWLCLVFGAGCQLLAGLMALANKQTLGGTLFTTFSFNWVMSFWALDQMAHGKVPDANVIASVDVAFLIVFGVLSYAFALVSRRLFVLLLDIDVLYAMRIARHFAHAPVGGGIALATVALGGIAAYIALAILVNDAAGAALMPLGGPVMRIARRPLAA